MSLELDKYKQKFSKIMANIKIVAFFKARFFEVLKVSKKFRLACFFFEVFFLNHRLVRPIFKN